MGNTTAQSELGRILLVDDNPSIHDDYRKILDSQTEHNSVSLDVLRASLFDVPEIAHHARALSLTSAYQGQEAVALAAAAEREQRPFEVAFIDIRMPPGWNGIETARELWKVAPALQVAFCSAYSDFTWDDMVNQLGCGDNWVIIKKPFEPVEIRQLAHALLRKWELMREREHQLRNLEQIVGQRTQQLENVNAQLRREIDGRLAVESQLLQARKLESLGRLAAGIGHEINNPLSFVIASLEFARETLAGGAEQLAEASLAELRQDLENARLGAERIRRIVDDMMLYCHPERCSKDSAAADRTCDLKAVTELALRLVGTDVRSRARVVLEFPEVPKVICSPSKLEQVVVNLLMNAAQALPSGHAPEHEIKIRTFCSGTDEVALEISDTGEGISKEDIERIFDPFFTTKPVGVGTGLGLSICQGIIQGAGGHIAIASERGKGTVVTVRLKRDSTPEATLPPKRAHTAPLAAPAPSLSSVQQPQGPARVLIVDDEYLIAQSLKRMLRGYQVTTCQSGREGLEQCLRETFDVVVCDLIMDDLTGMDLFQEIGKLAPDYQPKFVFVTGGAFTERARTFQQEIPNVFIAKPVDITALKTQIDRIHRGVNS